MPYYKVMKFGCFKKLETSAGLVWPAGQATGHCFTFSLAGQAGESSQPAGQARPGRKKVACYHL